MKGIDHELSKQFVKPMHHGYRSSGDGIQPFLF
jgi:hypothetical protein